MHVFVTGATGFVGFHTVMALHAAGHTVRLGIRNPDKMKKLYADTGVDISDYAIGEITDEDAVNKALEGCDAVVHTAAMVSLDANKEQLMRKTNLAGTQYVIGGAFKKGIKKIVYVSSIAAIFDRHARVLNESTPLAKPKSAYIKSKSECDKYVRGLIDEGAKIAITYPSAVIGPQDPAMSEGNQGMMFFFTLCFVNTCSGQQIIDVRELANAQVKLLELEKSGRYIVSGHFISWRDMGVMIEKIINKKLLKLTLPRWLLKITGRAVDFINRFYHIDTPLTREAVTFATEWVYADDHKIRKELDVEYRPLEETLRDTIVWLSEEKYIKPQWVEYIR